MGRRMRTKERGEEREEGRRPNSQPISPQPVHSQPVPSLPFQPRSDPSGQSLFTDYPPTPLPRHTYSYAYSFQAHLRGGGGEGGLVQCAVKYDQYYNQ